LLRCDNAAPLGATMKKNLLTIVFAFLFVSSLQAQTSSKKESSILEDKIIDTIASLKEVVERSKYVEEQTKGKRHLKFAIWDKPKKGTSYYWVKVMEDNGIALYTHFNFYVYPKTMTIKYYDTINDKVIDLTTWRKNQKG
jgi:hypothetical protein